MTEDGPVEPFAVPRVRRDLFRNVLGAASIAAAGAIAVRPTPAAAQAIGDVDLLYFLANLKYLQAQYFNIGSFNYPLSLYLRLSDTGRPDVIGGRAVTLTRLANDVISPLRNADLAQLSTLENEIRRMAPAVSFVQPPLDVSGTALGAFSRAARMAGLIADSGADSTQTSVFDAFANENNFLLGGYLLRDVSVTAYRGVLSLLTDLTTKERVIGLLGLEGYQAAYLREALYRNGEAVPSLRSAADAFSDMRDSLDGTVDNNASGVVADDDQGISPTPVTPINLTSAQAPVLVSNVNLLDRNGLGYSRSPAQVLNVVYLSRSAATAGGFFPAGLNGAIRTSAANA